MSGKKWRPDYWALLFAWGLFLLLVTLIELYCKR
jgi:hypothetical protein